MNVMICSTVYQLMVAIQLAATIYKDTDNYLVILDNIRDADKICSKVKSQKIFIGCDVVNCRGTNIHNWRLCFPKLFKDNEIIEYRLSSYLKSHITDIKTVLFANIGGFSASLAFYFKHNSPNISLAMFEDGAISYSKYYGKVIMKDISPKSIKERLMRAFHFTTFNLVENFYVFEPKLMVWNCPIPLKTILAISTENNRMRDTLNYIFDYSNIEDKYNEKVIFFEESYFGDKIEVGDVAIVKKLESMFGKKNIFIKRHPRIADNRFEHLGYKTNKNFVIPWEVIALNLSDLDSKILVTMTSTALLSTVLLFTTDAKIIFEIENIRNIDNARVLYTIEVIEKLSQLYPERVMLSINQLK